MKRKIFSKLLMVALVIAAVGSFVSCKDYDDDINNLQKQIDAKAAISELTALQSTLDSKIAAAQSAAHAAQATADAAATKTAVADLKTALESAIADAKKAGTDAGTEAGKAIAAANAAQASADAAAQAAKDADAAAKTALADALKTIEETYQTKAAAAEAAAEAAEALAAVKATADAAYTKAEAEKLQEQVNNLKSDLESAIDDKIDAKIKEVNNAVASVDAIWKAVTGVEIVTSNDPLAVNANLATTLRFLYGTKVANIFGGDKAPAGNAAIPYGKADKEITYKLGDEVELSNRILVRVNPANATFTKDQVVLLNSLGETLDDYVEVDSIQKYDQLITRANVETGLWVISFVRKAGITDDQLAEATQGEKVTADDPQQEGEALYAIGINNTTKSAADRIVYSTFDLPVFYGAYVPVDELSFSVKGKSATTDIDNLRNRWNGEKLIGEDLTAEKPVAGKWNAELIWNDATDAAKYVPAVDTAAITSSLKNYKTGDARYGEAFSYVDADKDKRQFTVIPGADWDDVEYYYVVLDQFAAVESAPSEYQAWKKYEYEGLGEMTSAYNSKTITIKSEAAVGDFIGFRVFAVNYDGTLVDPDGKAFYVRLGAAAADPKKTQTAAAQFVATDAAAPALATTFTYKQIGTGLANFAVISAEDAGLTPADFQDVALDADDAAGFFNVPCTTASGNDKKITDTEGMTGYYAFLKTYNAKNPAKNALATKFSEINYVAVVMNNPGMIVDEATLVTDITGIYGEDTDHHNAKVNSLSLTVKKVMPTKPEGFSWKSGLAMTGDDLTLFFNPNASGIGNYPANATNNGWAAASAWGCVDLSTLFNTGASTLANYRFVFDSADANEVASTATTADPTVFVSSTGAVSKTSYSATTTTTPWILALPSAYNVGTTKAWNLATATNTILDGTHTSGLTVQYKYADLSLSYGTYKTGATTTATGFYKDTDPFTGISVAVAAAAGGNNGGDFYAEVDTKDVTFSYAVANQSYRWAQYNTCSTYNATWGSAKWNSGVYDNYEISYTNALTAKKGFLPATKHTDPAAIVAGAGWKYTTADAAIVNSANNAWTTTVETLANGTAEQIDLTKCLISVNTVDPSLNDKPYTDYLVTELAVLKANGVNEYVVPTLGGTTITLAKQATAPSVSVPSQLVISGTDSFGQEVEYTLPVTIVP